MKNLIWSFAPWAAFLAGVRFGSVYWGAGIGVAVALAVLIRAITRHSVHLFDTIGVVYFGGLLLLLAAIHPSDIDTWGRYAQAVAHGSLTIIVFGSILIGKPFTEPYAREQVPESVWHIKQFHDLNRRISAVFGLAFLVGTASLILAGAENHSRQFILRLVIPFGALLLAFLYTQKQQARASSEVEAAGS